MKRTEPMSHIERSLALGRLRDLACKIDLWARRGEIQFINQSDVAERARLVMELDL